MQAIRPPGGLSMGIRLTEGPVWGIAAGVPGGPAHDGEGRRELYVHVLSSSIGPYSLT